MHFIVNLLFGLLAFFVVRYVAGLVLPEGNDKDKIVVVLAFIAAIVVFFANFAVNIN